MGLDDLQSPTNWMTPYEFPRCAFEELTDRQCAILMAARLGAIAPGNVITSEGYIGWRSWVAPDGEDVIDILKQLEAKGWLRFVGAKLQVLD